MEIKRKLEILADAAKYDASCASSGSNRKRHENGVGNTEGMGICHSYTPDGRCVSLLKILLTNFCIYDCRFCINRNSSNTPRAKFSPEEVVNLTLQFYRRNYIEGLFLSSGIIESVDYTMEQLIKVARSLREDHHFHGYIHLKVVPGASVELIDEAGKWADRISANIEMPTQDDLNKVAPAKTLPTVFKSMDQIKERVSESKEQTAAVKLGKSKVEKKFAPAGQTTQMIVGATETNDSVILERTQSLYSDFRLRRVYYSAYSPIPNADAILPIKQPSLVRENRLYQADWLLRFYGFKAGELTTKDNGFLSLDVDPKTNWALQNRSQFPIDVNSATKEQLLRVPGFGVRNVERILQVRRIRKIRMDDLKRLRVGIKRARYFIITADHNPHVHDLDKVLMSEFLKQESSQLSLFDTFATTVKGEL